MNTELTDEEINVKLAEALGWKRLRQDDGWSESICKTHMGKPGEDLVASPPNYTGSYDAVMPEILKLNRNQQAELIRHLFVLLDIVRDAEFGAVVHTCASILCDTSPLILSLALLATLTTNNP